MSENFWAGRRVLVTGGMGFLGWKVVGACSGAGASVIVPRHEDVDLRSQRACGAYFAFRSQQMAPGPEIVIHCAGLVGGIQANLARPAEFFRDNILMGLNVLDACLGFGVQKVVMVGTTCSYPDFSGFPSLMLGEADLWSGYPEPSNAPYGIAKRALLTACQAYRQQFGLRVAYVIPANLYGPGDHFAPERSHVIPALIRKCIEARDASKSAITVWGSGRATREFLYVEDAAEALLRAAQMYDDPQPINVGSGEEVTIEVLAEMVAKATGFTGDIIWDTTQPEGQARRCLDVSRAEDLLGWRAKTSLREGIEKTVAWYEATRKCEGGSISFASPLRA